MAKVASVNVDCATNGGAQVIWNLVSLLIANGWTKFADSDGTTYSGAGTQVTGPGSGANGLNNNSAWVALQEPSGAAGRKYLFQRGTAESTWLIRYVRTSTLNTAGNATTLPSNPSIAGDLRDIHSSGVSGNTGIPATLFGATTPVGNYYAHAVTETVPDFGVYQFWFAITAKLTGSIGGGGYVIGLDTVAASSGLDQDPSANNIASSGSNWFGFSNIRTWNFFGLVSPAPAFLVSASRFGPTTVSVTNQYTGNDQAFPFLLTAGTQPYKGQGTWIRQALTNRAYPDTFNLLTDAYLYTGTGGLLLPWPNNVVPQL